MIQRALLLASFPKEECLQELTYFYYSAYMKLETALIIIETVLCLSSLNKKNEKLRVSEKMIIWCFSFILKYSKIYWYIFEFILTLYFWYKPNLVVINSFSIYFWIQYPNILVQFFKCLFMKLANDFFLIMFLRCFSIKTN